MLVGSRFEMVVMVIFTGSSLTVIWCGSVTIGLNFPSSSVLDIVPTLIFVGDPVFSMKPAKAMSLCSYETHLCERI